MFKNTEIFITYTEVYGILGKITVMHGRGCLIALLFCCWDLIPVNS